jgi:formyltetrahydrofolate deformylase
VLCTKDPACLYDLVLRQRAGELRCELPIILSNHEYLASAAAAFDIPFEVLPVTAATKPAQEQAIAARLREHRIDLVVLARYMQVLSAELLAAAPPVINIHHGFLPAFQGAKPYHQAHARSEDDRGDGALRDEGSRSGADHRAGRGARDARDGAGGDEPRRP